MHGIGFWAEYGVKLEDVTIWTDHAPIILGCDIALHCQDADQEILQLGVRPMVMLSHTNIAWASQRH